MLIEKSTGEKLSGGLEMKDNKEAQQITRPTDLSKKVIALKKC